MPDYQELLRKLALGDHSLVATILAGEPALREPDLDVRTQSLVRLSVTVAVDAGQASYGHAVDEALSAGASADEIVATLVAVISLTGVPRATSAAPKLALALGYDVDAALEAYD